MLSSAAEEVSKPVMNFSLNTIEVEFLQQYGVVNLVKGFTEVQIEDICVLIGIQVIHNVFNMVEELCQAASSSSEAVLVGVNDVLGFNVVNQLSTEYSFKHLYQVGC